jgi:hypothetical protein
LPNPELIVYPIKTNISSVVIGWGVLEEGGSMPNSLQNVKITIYSNEMCANSTLFMETNWSSQICAGEYSGGKDSCQGDRYVTYKKIEMQVMTKNINS